MKILRILIIAIVITVVAGALLIGTRPALTAIQMGRAVYYSVASYTAPAHVREQADFVSNNATDEQVTIQAALDALPVGGGTVKLLGRFVLGPVGSGDLLSFKTPYTILSGQGPGESGAVGLYIASGTNYTTIIKSGNDMSTVENLSINGNRDNTTGLGRGIDLSGVIDNTVRWNIVYGTRGPDIYSYSSVTRMMWMHFVYNNWLEGSPAGVPTIHYSWRAGTPIGNYELRDSYFNENVIGRGVLFEAAPGRTSGYSYQDIQFIGNKGMHPFTLDRAQNIVISLNNQPQGSAGTVNLTNSRGVSIVGNTNLKIVNGGADIIGNPDIDSKLSRSLTVNGNITATGTISAGNFFSFPAIKQRTGMWLSSLLLGSNVTPRTDIDANKLNASPIVLPQAATLTGLGIWTTTGGNSTAEVRIGIYSDNGNWQPANLLIDAGVISAGTPGLLNKSISMTLPAGIYWIASNSNSNDIVYNTPANATIVPILEHASSGAKGWKTSVAYGLLPASFPPDARIGPEIPLFRYWINSWN